MRRGEGGGVVGDGSQRWEEAGAAAHLFAEAKRLMDELDTKDKRPRDAAASDGVLQFCRKAEARLGVEAVAAGDGGCTRDRGKGNEVVTRGWLLATMDGELTRGEGIVPNDDGDKDNYDGEIAARLEVLDAARKKGVKRLIYFTDATSPLEASRGMRGRHLRSRAKMVCDEELGACMVLEDGFELVIYLWGKSLVE